MKERINGSQILSIENSVQLSLSQGREHKKPLQVCDKGDWKEGTQTVKEALQVPSQEVLEAEFSPLAYDDFRVLLATQH